MSETPEASADQTREGSDWSTDDEIFYPTAGPGSAFVTHATLRVIVFLWLLGLIPGAILANALAGDPADASPDQLPIGGFIVVGWGLTWTILYTYFVVTRRGRTENGTTIELTPAGIQAIDHLGIMANLRWEDVTSIGFVRLPSAGSGLAKATKPMTQPDSPPTKIGSADGLIGRADLIIPERLPKGARKLLAGQQHADPEVRPVGIGFFAAGRVDDANPILRYARDKRPDLFADRIVKQPR